MDKTRFVYDYQCNGDGQCRSCGMEKGDFHDRGCLRGLLAGMRGETSTASETVQRRMDVGS